MIVSVLQTVHVLHATKTAATLSSQCDGSGSVDVKDIQNDDLMSWGCRMADITMMFVRSPTPFS